jgi:hypothetical protein
MNANYNNPVLRQLRDQQVRFAPRDQQLEQANRAERLLTEIEPPRTASSRSSSRPVVSAVRAVGVRWSAGFGLAFRTSVPSLLACKAGSQ